LCTGCGAKVPAEATGEATGQTLGRFAAQYYDF